MGAIDFGRHSDDYAAHRPGFPASFYARLEALVPFDGARVLDLASGPGTVALELAARGAEVLGIDVAAGQVEVARRAARERGLADRARFEVARAEDTGLAPGSVDLVAAGHCWHWFDGEAVLREARRVLRPCGALVLAYHTYLARHSAVARDSEELVLAFHPAWPMAGGDGMYAERVDELIGGGFRLVEQFCYDRDEPFTHERWRGRMRTCNGVGSGCLPPAEVERFDRELARLLRERHPEPMTVEHRVWCVVVRLPA